jgi:hypothetical protein
MPDGDFSPLGTPSRALSPAAQEERADLVSFRVVSSEDPAYFFNDEYRVGMFAYWGCAALISRRAADELHGYDPNIFFWANELDFTMRLLDRGWRHLFLPEVVPVHMKPPSNPEGGFMLDPIKINRRHWSYIAGKALHPRDAVTAFLSNLFWVLYVAAFDDRRALRATPAVVAGFLSGLRARAPVRAEVSRLYRRECREMSNPLRWAPRDIVRKLLGRIGPDESREQALEEVFARRPAYYPTARAALEVPAPDGGGR